MRQHVAHLGILHESVGDRPAVGASTRMSRSPTVSRPRRKLPAMSARRTPGSACRYSSSASPYCAAAAREIRFSSPERTASSPAIFFSIAAPNPGTVLRRPARAARASPAIDRSPRVSTRARARMGPIPGTPRNSTAACGTSRRSSRSSLSEPVEAISAIFAARSSPIPASSRRRSCDSEAAGSGSSSITRAAFVYARTRNAFARSRPSSSATSRSSLAISALGIRCRVVRRASATGGVALSPGSPAPR